MNRAQSTAHRAPHAEHRAQSTAHTAAHTEHRARSTTHGAPRTEHRAPSTEHRALRTEHRAARAEQRAQICAFLHCKMYDFHENVHFHNVKMMILMNTPIFTRGTGIKKPLGPHPSASGTRAPPEGGGQY